MSREIVYFSSLSSPWAYLGGPRFHILSARHDLKVVLPPDNCSDGEWRILCATRPSARQGEYHELELDRWRQ